MAPTNMNAPVQGLPYFSPAHLTSPGTPFDPNAPVPTLFKPLQIRGATLKNRIIVAPMCQYSCADSGPQVGALTPYHVATLGHYALKGASLVFIEASGVQPNGRISPNCPGIWSDAQIDGVKAVADFIHSQGALCALQLAHAGRKSSTVAPFLSTTFERMPSVRATKDVGGWPEDVVGPSGGEEQIWDTKKSDDPKCGYWPPRELTVEEIQQVVRDFASAAARSVRAGVDVLEIHGAHGYLIHQFLSPISNRRTDNYGGSFENRTRLLLEIIQAIRAVIPNTTPLFLRLSSTEWMEETSLGKQLGSWTVDDTIKLTKIITDLGVDLLDVSSGGNHPQQRIGAFGGAAMSKDYQIRIASRIRGEVKAAGKGILIGAVGLITEAEQARDILENDSDGLKQEAEIAKEMTEPTAGKEPMADVILVARQFMREPEWVLKVAWRLGLDIAWPSQFLRVRFPKL